MGGLLRTQRLQEGDPGLWLRRADTAGHQASSTQGWGQGCPGQTFQ